MVVDDHAPTRQLVERQLKSWGHTVHGVGSGLEALQLLAQNTTLQLLIVDWIMPSMDGLELCRLARQMQASQERPHNLYILFLTERHGSDDFVAALRAGADAFMQKSGSSAELQAQLGVVQRCIALERQLAQQLQTLQLQNEELLAARTAAEDATRAKGDF